MNECLITKLKASIDDDSLNYLGYITLRGTIPTGTPDGLNYIGVDGGVEPYAELAVVKKGSIKKVSTGTQEGNGVRGHNIAFNLNDGDFVVIIPKHLIKGIHSLTHYAPIDLNQLTFCPNLELVNNLPTTGYGDISAFKDLKTLTSLTINNNKNIYGDISVLKNLVNLTKFDFNLCGRITGNIADLGKMTSLTHFNFGGTKVQGSLESLVESQRRNNRSSGSINCPYLGACLGLTFNGQNIANRETNTLTWTESTITLNEVTINA